MSARVLVIRGGAIGDFILTLPAIRLLRENIPACHLEVLGYTGIAELAKAAGWADAVRALDHRDMAMLFAPGAPIADEVADYLRSFTLVVSYLFDPDGHFCENLKRIGVTTLIECPHRVQPDQGPAAAQLARPLSQLAMFLDDPAPIIRVKPEVILPHPQPGEMSLVVHVGSGSETKNWPLENWFHLIRSMQQQQSIRIILLTGEAEEARGMTETLDGADWSGLFFERWHQVPLVTLAARLNGLALQGATSFVGHDSGISHLAAACGLDCLLLFGPSDPAIWAPQNPGVRLLRAPEGDLRALTPEAVLHQLGLHSGVKVG